MEGTRWCVYYFMVQHFHIILCIHTWYAMLILNYNSWQKLCEGLCHILDTWLECRTINCLRNDHDSALISCPVEVIISPACQHVKIGKIVNVLEALDITIVIKTLCWWLSLDSGRLFQNQIKYSWNTVPACYLLYLLNLVVVGYLLGSQVTSEGI